jgi:phage-related protein
MADNEKKVTYKAEADFSPLNRSVDKAIRKFNQLKKAQAELNASSAAAQGSMAGEAAAFDKATASTGKHVKALNEDVAATGKHSGALTAQAAAAERAAAAMSRGADAAVRSRASHEDAAKAAKDFEAGVSGAASAAGKAETAAGRMASAVGKAGATMNRSKTQFAAGKSEMTKLQASFAQTLNRATRLKSGLDRLGNWRPRLTPPFIALVPLIAAVVAAINPLVAGLGAVSSAALGFGSSLGTLAGAAIGIVPALSTLLGVVGALKLAFGGIGGAFKAANKLNAGGGGGGGAPKNTQIELTQTEKITRAQEEYRRSIQDVGYAEEDLDDARKDYIKRVQDLQKAVDRAAASQARAAANSRLAQENYANVLADPGSTKGDKMDAAAQVTDAKNDYKDVVDENKQNAKELADLKKTGINGDRQVVMAQRAVTDALNKQRDAQIDLQNAQKGTNDAASAGGGAADAYAAALDKLSPSARSVVEQLVAMRGEWNKMRLAVQESFFSKIVDDIQLLRKLFPPVTKLLSNLAGAMGTLASQLIRKVTSDSWIKDIYKFADESVKPVNDIGAGLLDLLEAFKDLTIAALPFLTELAAGFKDSAKNFADLVATARQDGSLANYLERVRSKMSQWWRIVKNIGSAIINYGKAAGDFGDWLTDGFERVTKGWANNAKDATKAGSPFKKYLNDIKPLISNINGLLGDFFQWLGRTSSSKDFIDQMNEIVRLFRSRVGPAISDILDTMAKTGVSTALMDALGSLAELIDTILKNGGAEAIKNFFSAVDTGFKALSEFAKIPGVSGIMTTLFQGLAGLAAISFVGKFTGLTSLLGLLIRAGKSKGVGGLLDRLKGAGGKAAGAAAATAAEDGVGAAVGGKAAASTGRRFPLFTSGSGGEHVAGRARHVASSGGKAAAIESSAVKGINALGKEAGPLAKVLKGIGSGAKFLGRGVGPGAVLSVAGGLAGDAIADGAAKGNKGATQRVGGSILSGAATGAGIGATVGGAIGSVVPVAGTAVGAGVGAAVGGAAGGAASFLTAKPEDKQKFLDDIKNFFTKDVPNFIKGIPGTIFDGLKSLNDWLIDTWDGAMKWLQDLPRKIAYAAGVVWGNIQNFGDWLVEKWNDAVAWVQGLPKRIADTAKNIWGNIKSFLSWLGDKWNDAVAWVQGLPRRIANAAKNIWANIPTFINWLRKKWDESVIWFQNLPEKIKNAAGDIWDGITGIGGWLGKQGDKVHDWAVGLKDNIKNWLGDAFSGVGDSFSQGEKAARKNAKKKNGRHNGGPIKRAGGGTVPGRGNSDTVPAMLTPGEFVLRKAISDRIGEDNLQRLNSGLMGFGQMLSRAQQTSPSGMGKSRDVAFFNAGGSVPQTPMSVSKFAPKNAAGNDYSMHFGNIIVNNPVPEKASESLPQAIRRASSMGAARRGISNDA